MGGASARRPEGMRGRGALLILRTPVVEVVVVSSVASENPKYFGFAIRLAVTGIESTNRLDFIFFWRDNDDFRFER